MNRSKILFLCGFFLLSCHYGAYSVDNKDMTSSSETLVKNACDRITELNGRVTRDLGASVSDAQRKKVFRLMLAENFDVQRMGRFVLANYWRLASEDQQKQFLSYFEDYLVKTYADMFKSYTGKNFKIISSREAPDTQMILITTTVDIPKKGATHEMAPLEIEWRLKHDQNGFKIVDLTVEKVSLSITKRQEFGSIIQENGGKIEGLLRRLEQETKDVRHS